MELQVISYINLAVVIFGAGALWTKVNNLQKEVDSLRKSNSELRDSLHQLIGEMRHYVKND